MDSDLEDDLAARLDNPLYEPRELDPDWVPDPDDDTYEARQCAGCARLRKGFTRCAPLLAPP